MDDFFSSVFTRSNGDSPPKAAINGNCSLSEIEVTEERVKMLIDGMKEDGAPGPDGFPPSVKIFARRNHHATDDPIPEISRRWHDPR